jgi:hypothetical protein
MNHTTPTPLTVAHLQTVIRHWTDLRDALETQQTDTWPPRGRLAYLAALDEADAELVRADDRAEHAERNANSLGERPVPLRLPVLDTIRGVQAALVETADTIAGSGLQRPIYIPQNVGRGWTDELHRQLLLLAAKDAADKRRWRFRGERSAADAAGWLLARVKGEPGPFRPLTEAHHRRITSVAQEAAARVEKALGLARQDDAVPRPCPRCGQPLTLHHGGGEPPEVTCKGGCRPWAGPELAGLLARLDETPAGAA